MNAGQSGTMMCNEINIADCRTLIQLIAFLLLLNVVVVHKFTQLRAKSFIDICCSFGTYFLFPCLMP